MTIWSWIRDRLGVAPAVGGSHASTAEVESGRSEDTGGVAGPSTPDRHSTTGTTPGDTFVGRPAGDDVGYLETGAEKRTAAGDDDPPSEQRR